MGHDLPTTLYYYNDESDSNPYGHTGKPVKATVNDISGKEDKYTLDNDGFQLVHQVTKVTDFLDVENVKTNYYPEIEQLLKEV
jgi:glucose-6-phosphate isomerase